MTDTSAAAGNPLTTTQPAKTAVKDLLLVIDDGEFGMLMDTAKFGQLQRIGTMYAKSKMVPSHFQGDEASCMVAVQMAMRLKIDPFMFLQKTYVVSGKPGMEAPLVIALINTRGPFVGPIDWNLKVDDKGDVIECTAFATHKGTGRVCSSTVTWKMVEAEGWSKKSGSKWLTLREQMFRYRSAAFLGRLYCPEVLMGMATADELVDQEIDVTPTPATPPPVTTLKGRMGIVQPIEAEVVEPNPNVSAHSQPPQEAAGSAAAPADVPKGQPALDLGSQVASSEPAMPFDDLLGYAKKAKTKEQGDVVLDALRSGYTEAQAQQVRDILNSKAYNAKPE